MASIDNVFSVNKLSQIISFTAISNNIASDAPFIVSTTSSSGLAVSYSIVSDLATISGNTITLTGVSGTEVVRASQVGNAIFSSKTYDRSIRVSKLPQTITVGGVVSAPVAVDASGNTTFDMVSPAPSSITVKATYSGSANFNTSSSATITQK